jgi:hypothetical protein
MLGMAPAPRATLARFVRQVRALCAGAVVVDRRTPLRLAFGGAGRGPPIFLAAAGPRMLRLASPLRGRRRRAGDYAGDLRARGAAPVLEGGATG